jgi:SAM-dependent methyltransferase
MHHEGVWRFLPPGRQTAIEPFARQYRLIREREGYRVSSPEYYRRLPNVAPDDPHAHEWRLRKESFAHLLRNVLAYGCASMRILDVGAGCGWMSHRLAALGHHLTAVDALDDGVDGLGASRHYNVGFVRVQADFDALPFAPQQFDLVVFNGSLHYAPDIGATLAHARRMLAPGGTLVVMDSPMFDRDRQASTGYVTFATLADAARRLALRARFVRSRGPLRWRIGRRLEWLRLHRAPAAFGLWIAQ